MLDHPLLNPDRPAAFSRKISGKLTQGRVYSQFQDQYQKHLCHPSVFYVEFPEGAFYEISSRRLLLIIGDGASTRPFHRTEIAARLESMSRSLDLIKLMPHLAPPNP